MSRVYGLLAEFGDPEQVLAAAKKTHNAGYRRVEAYSPFPVHGLSEALGFSKTRLPLLVLIGGLLGGAGGYGLQYWISVIDYPLNIGGRPLHSWPAFIPVTFELAVLAAALTAVFGMLALNGLPRPHHPVFNAPRFQTASKDRFFIFIRSVDPLFDEEKTRRFLEELGPREVVDVDFDVR